MNLLALEFPPVNHLFDWPTILFDDTPFARSIWYATYDVDPQSGEFLMASTSGNVPLDLIVAVQWLSEVRGRLGSN